MKNHSLLSLFVGLLAFGFSATTFAQSGEGGIVAVLDVARVFNENLEFDNAMQRIRAEADQLKQSIQGEMDQIRTDASALSSMAVGSAERNQLEASLEQRQTAVRTKARQAEADLLTKEAQLYYTTYQKLQQIVARVSQENNVSLVLRFDSAPIDKDNRGEVIMGVNRAVVYHYKLDLTNLVIQNMGPTVARADTGTINK